MDHWFQMEAMWPAEEPMLEGYTTLGFVDFGGKAAQVGTDVSTSTLKLGRMPISIAFCTGGLP